MFKFKPTIIKITILLLTLSSTAIATEARNNYTRTYFEVVTETDNIARLSGFHFLQSIEAADGNSLAVYFGGGPVYVTLPDQQEEFPAIHALIGLNYSFSHLLAANLEFGFDLGEQILSGDDRGTPTLNGEQNNQIDYSLLAGVVFNLDKSIYLKSYARYHQFDGIFLKPTEVTLVGIRLGVNF